jgi:hypothetical protein
MTPDSSLSVSFVATPNSKLGILEQMKSLIGLCERAVECPSFHFGFIFFSDLLSDIVRFR